MKKPMTLDELKEELECLMEGTLKYPDNDYDDAICSAVKLIEHNRAALEAGMISERIKELDKIIETMEENIQVLEAGMRGTLRFKIERTDNDRWSDTEYEWAGYLLTTDKKTAATRWGQPRRSIIADGKTPEEVKKIFIEFAESLGFIAEFEETSE